MINSFFYPTPYLSHFVIFNSIDLIRLYRDSRRELMKLRFSLQKREQSQKSFQDVSRFRLKKGQIIPVMLIVPRALSTVSIFPAVESKCSASTHSARDLERARARTRPHGTHVARIPRTDVSRSTALHFNRPMHIRPSLAKA